MTECKAHCEERTTSAAVSVINVTVSDSREPDMDKCVYSKSKTSNPHAHSGIPFRVCSSPLHLVRPADWLLKMLITLQPSCDWPVYQQLPSSHWLAERRRSKRRGFHSVMVTNIWLSLLQTAARWGSCILICVWPYCRGDHSLSSALCRNCRVMNMKPTPEDYFHFWPCGVSHVSPLCCRCIMFGNKYSGVHRWPATARDCWWFKSLPISWDQWGQQWENWEGGNWRLMAKKSGDASQQLLL